jgi:hypothetical protein
VVEQISTEFSEDLLLLRCAIGVTTGHLPDDFLDLVLSSSVPEHVGQAEVGYDVSSKPPAGDQSVCIVQFFSTMLGTWGR